LAITQTKQTIGRSYNLLLGGVCIAAGVFSTLGVAALAAGTALVIFW